MCLTSSRLYIKDDYHDHIFKHCLLNCRYLDKTVMEMQSQQGSSHAGFFSDSLSNYGLDNLFNFGTRIIVKLRVEVTINFLFTVTEGSKDQKRKKQEKVYRIDHCFSFKITSQNKMFSTGLDEYHGGNDSIYREESIQQKSIA